MSDMTTPSGTTPGVTDPDLGEIVESLGLPDGRVYKLTKPTDLITLGEAINTAFRIEPEKASITALGNPVQASATVPVPLVVNVPDQDPDVVQGLIDDHRFDPTVPPTPPTDPTNPQVPFTT